MSDWIKKPLSDLIDNGSIELGRGRIISKVDIQNIPGPYPIYSSSAKGDGSLGSYGKYMFDEELITWSVDGGGNLFYRPKHKFSVTNVSGFMRVHSKRIDYRFLHYLLSFQHSQITFDYQMKAHPSVIKNLYYFVPLPVVEQRKIAEILTTVDDAIEQTEALIHKYQRIKQGLMQDLLTKGVFFHRSLILSELGPIPEDWEVIKIKNITKVRRGASPRPIDDPRFFNDKGRGWVRISDVTSTYKYLRTTSQYLSDLGTSLSVKVNPGDLVMSICASIGKPIILDMEACIHDGFVVFQDIHPDFDTEFLFYFLDYRSQFIKSLNQTGTQGNLNTTIVNSISVPKPSLLEQKKISSFLSKIDEIINHEIREKEKLVAIKQGLMQDLLTGKVRVNALLD